MELDPPTLQIRGARPADALRVARCYLPSRRTLSDYAPLPHTDADVITWVKDRLLPTGGVTLALESGHVVGFIALSVRDDATWVDQLYVHPARMRRGIGSTLLHLALCGSLLPVANHVALVIPHGQLRARGRGARLIGAGIARRRVREAEEEARKENVWDYF